MNQINVNPPGTAEDPVESSGDRTAAAGLNLITVVIVLAVLAVIAWYLFTGPLRNIGSGSSTTNVQVNPAPTAINVNPPANQQAPSTGSSSSTSSTTTTTTTNATPPAPPKP
jgi:hypothetical protein